MAPMESVLPQWVGSMQDDFSLQTQQLNNLSVAFYHPWGSPWGSAAVAILYSLWVTAANTALVAVMLTSPRLLNSRQNILILHLAIVDLAVGLFYCPLTADFYIRGQWTHGCDSFFVWFIFLYPQVFFSVHLLGLLNAVRLLGGVCPVRSGRWVKNVLFAGSLMLLWFYIVMIGASLDASRRDNFRIAISRDHLCRALVASDGAIATNVLVFVLPASVTVLLFLANLVREKTARGPLPQAQLQLDCQTEQISRAPLNVLAAATLASCLMPLPAFIATTAMASGACSSTSCLRWAVPFSTVAEWLLFAKAGCLPVIWLLSPDFKGALVGAFHHFRRVPTSDTRDLVDGEMRAGEADDTPFSEM